MNLCCDIGNTRVKIAVFDYHDMKLHAIVEDSADSRISEVMDDYRVEKAIISTTRGETTAIEAALKKKLDVLYVDDTLDMPYTNTYTTKNTLGKDRMAVVAAATMKYPQENSLIVDTGTCVTYDFVDKEAVYHGGNIAPGLRSRLRSMHDYTTSLPLVEGKTPDSVLGRATTTALQNGAFYGLLYEIEGYERQLSTEFGEINVILTGGDADIFGEYMKSKIFVHPYLVLEGLNEILKLNE